MQLVLFIFPDLENNLSRPVDRCKVEMLQDMCILLPSNDIVVEVDVQGTPEAFLLWLGDWNNLMHKRHCIL